MNYNLLSYLIFLTVTLYIIIVVGRQFYTKGRVFILNLFRGDEVKTDGLNKVILIAYYLFNMGYALVAIKLWDTIISLSQMIATLSSFTGLLILILAVTHYINLYLVYYLSKKSFSFFIH